MQTLQTFLNRTVKENVYNHSYLLAWGRNVHAQLSLAYASEHELTPKLVTSKATSTITQICTGGHAYEHQGHTICRTDSGSVYSWGWNAFGQLGKDNEDNILRLRTSCPK